MMVKHVQIIPNKDHSPQELLAFFVNIISYKVLQSLFTFCSGRLFNFSHNSLRSAGILPLGKIEAMLSYSFTFCACSVLFAGGGVGFSLLIIIAKLPFINSLLYFIPN
jgi:hypothetical protein